MDSAILPSLNCSSYLVLWHIEKIPQLLVKTKNESEGDSTTWLALGLISEHIWISPHLICSMIKTNQDNVDLDLGYCSIDRTQSRWEFIKLGYRKPHVLVI